MGNCGLRGGLLCWECNYFLYFYKNSFVMDTSVLRLNVIDQIRNKVDDELLMDIARLIKADESHKIIIFTDEQNEIIQNSIKEYKEGNYVTGKVAEEDIQKWLKD